MTTRDRHRRDCPDKRVHHVHGTALDAIEHDGNAHGSTGVK